MSHLETLAKGWTSQHPMAANDFAHRVGEKLQAEIRIKQSENNLLFFTADLSGIRLQGMEEVQCLLLGGEDVLPLELLKEFKQRLGLSNRLTIILATSLQTYAQAQAEWAPGKVLLLFPAQLETLLTANEPILRLKQWLREQIPLRRLIPYSHLLSVEGGMFFGRRNELDKLYYESDVSFAIPGPGRIGKTSLVKEYKRRLSREHDPFSTRTFYIDFFHSPKDNFLVVRHLAMQLESSRRSNGVTTDTLLDFLRYQHSKAGGTLNLLFDEVDDVCGSEAFDVLGEAAKLRYCRLVLAGRAKLLSTMLYSESSLRQRLQLLRLDPLDEAAARNLLLAPMIDLGFQIEDIDRLVEWVFRLTGRLPHLMQYLARKLVELAIDEGATVITTTHLETLKWDFEVAQFFISPLQSRDLDDPRLRLIAFLLLKQKPALITPRGVQALAARWGVRMDELQALRVCNELAINNVLVWNRGVFQIANEALVDYARHLDILDNAIETARRALQNSSTATPAHQSTR